MVKTAEEKSEYNKQYLKRWRKLNPDYMKKWSENNPSRDEYNKKYKRQWYLKNREQLAIRQKERYLLLDREKVNAYHRKWQRARYAADPAGELLKVHARRTKTKGVKISKEDISNWYSRICGICGNPIEDKFHIDHIIPLSRGGKHEVANLQLAHPLCNWRKNNKLQEEM